MNVTKTAAINLDKDKHTFRLSFVFALYPTPVRNCREALYGDFETAVGLSARAVTEGRVFDVEAAEFDLRRDGLHARLSRDYYPCSRNQV
jgi:hypothetical protein